jgi:hypothetical protein
MMAERLDPMTGEQHSVSGIMSFPEPPGGCRTPIVREPTNVAVSRGDRRYRNEAGVKRQYAALGSQFAESSLLWRNVVRPS